MGRVTLSEKTPPGAERGVAQSIKGKRVSGIRLYLEGGSGGFDWRMDKRKANPHSLGMRERSQKKKALHEQRWDK